MEDDVKVMNHDNAKMDNGPCRELAKTILAQRIDRMIHELGKLEALRKVAEAMVPGSEEEIALWELLLTARANDHRATW